MPDSNGKSVQMLYKAAVVILLALASFIGANIYTRVSDLPEKYVTLERYRCDVDKLTDSISEIGRKLDRYVFKEKERDR